jgi:type II secretory pathway pseudopilin PulG
VANIKVLLYDQAGVEYDVSYIQEIPLSLSYLIADVKDPSKRNTTFSKTINFNSKDVDLFFRVIWKLNSTLTTFDPRLKCKIKYYVNEVLQLDGDLQLIKVIVDPDSKTVNYQTTATGTIGNLFLAIGDAY